ncbi:MAG: class I SAM-dependent methyltransferase [Thermaerobacterales bacterium]
MKKGQRSEQAIPWWQELYDLRYRSGWRETVSSTEEQADLLEAVLDLSLEHQILDVPCGYGRHALALARRGFQLTGIDVSPNLIDQARRGAQELAGQYPGRPLPRFDAGDMRHLSFDAIFDRAYVMDVSFGFFSEAGNRAVLAGLSRALKPGGRLMLDLFNPHSVAELEGQQWMHGAGNQAAGKAREDGDDADQAHRLYENEFDVSEGALYFHERLVYPGGKWEDFPAQRVRVYTVPELAVMLAEAGLRLYTLQGLYATGQPTRMIPGAAGPEADGLALVAERLG